MSDRFSHRLIAASICASRGWLWQIAILGFFALAGCGVSYTSPAVRGDDEAGTVEVVALTAQTVETANMSPYTPRRLPAAFYAVAGHGSLVGTGALPVAPDIPDRPRERVEFRPPPDAEKPPYRIGIGDVVLLATG